jgi:hypothetical protein
MPSIRNRARAALELLCDAADFSRVQQEQTMLDILLIAGGTALFLVGIAYTYACERI